MLLHADSTEGAYSTSPELNITGGEGLAALCPKISPLFSASFNLAFRLFGQAAALRALQLWGGFLLVGENRRPWRFVYNIPGSNQVVVDIIDMCIKSHAANDVKQNRFDEISYRHRIASGRQMHQQPTAVTEFCRRLRAEQHDDLRGTGWGQVRQTADWLTDA